MLKFILKPGKNVERNQNLIEKMKDEMMENRKIVLKNKIKSISKMMKMFKVLREEKATNWHQLCCKNQEKILKANLLKNNPSMTQIPNYSSFHFFQTSS